MGETRVVALKCPGCGAPLKINEKIVDFACSYCGSAVKVERGEGTVSLHLLNDALHGVKQGTDKTAAELAIRRLTEELSRLEQERVRRDAQYTEVWNHWSERLATIKGQNPIAFVFAVAVGAGFVSSTLSYQACSSIFKKVSPSRAELLSAGQDLPVEYWCAVMLVTALSIFFACRYVLRTLIRGQARQFAEAKELQARALSPPESLCVEIRKRIETVQARIKRNEEFVDT